ncbi:MAG TPA: 2-C-methyl-D-erythritol 4-phosphate cytidylyltransferase [Chitinophagaceae bacterium]|nr:2-C-methyl-D-erythritol 4-phosphate cytidylyltransferase [Chitinophagaceae bacterium]
MHKYAIIVAGGTGTRMGANLPKQFMLLKGKPVLYYTLKAFLNAFDDLQVILVLPAEYLAVGQEIVNGYFDKSRIHITTGGATRFQSVKNGLALIEKESIIFVHDAVRCLVSVNLIQRCYEQAVKTGTAIPAIPSKDSIRLMNGDTSEPFDRNKVMLLQTPQTFQSKILLPAFQTDFKEEFTDEATVVEASGVKVSLIEGEENNIKLTRPGDLIIAEKILEGK